MAKINFLIEDNTSIHLTTVYRIPKSYSVRQLNYAIKHAKSNPTARYSTGDETFTAKEYRLWFLNCLHKKINRFSPGRGRKDGGDGYWSDWERNTRQLAWRVNTPRLIVRVSEVPIEFRARLAHRLHSPEDF